MVVFLSSIAILLAVGMATRLAMRDEGLAGHVPSFKVPD